MAKTKKLSALPPPRVRRTPIDPPASPAIISPDMVQDRGYKDDAGRISQNKAWRRLSPLQAAYAKGQITKDQEQAGKRYSETFATSERGGRDSTQALNSSRGSAPSAGAGNASSEAWDERLILEKYMGARDRTIIRLVCGEGLQPAAAVKQACGDGYKDTALARFREALDALIDAYEAIRPSKHSSAKKVA